jgi:hypothetical protein
MPLIFQKRIYRTDLQANPQVLYLFGDNEARVGLGGQAREMRGEPNAIGIATKRTPGSDEDAYWTMEDTDRQIEVLRKDLRLPTSLLIQGRTVVYPLDGVGTGLSELPVRAPKCMEYINEWVDLMRRPS